MLIGNRSLDTPHCRYTCRLTRCGGARTLPNERAVTREIASLDVMVSVTTTYSSSSHSHLIVRSLRQRQLSSSQFCHGRHRLHVMVASSHVSVGIVHPSLVRSSYSSSSPWWYQLQSLSSDVLLSSSLPVSKPPQSRFPAPLCNVLYLRSLHLCHH